MTMTDQHPTTSRRLRGLVSGAALVLTGATLAAAASALMPLPEASAASVNYVKSVNPDAVSQVLLDEEIRINFNVAVLADSVGPDTILVRTGINNGEQAQGRYIVGTFLFDKAAQRRVVIVPESIREYYTVVKGLPRVDAERQASAFIRRLERSGRISMLNDVDRQLKLSLGLAYGTRLDDEGVFYAFPSQLNDTTADNDDPLTLDPGDSPQEPFRTRIAGDDALWQAYLVGGDINAFTQLSENSEFERFFHPIDQASGVPSASSVLRQRQHRRVLINRKNPKTVMFVPDIPIRGDLLDTGYTAGRAYSVIVPAAQPGVFNTVLTKTDHRPLLQRGGRDFSTLFTTVPSTNGTLFRDGEARSGVSTLQRPRVINQTPPNGEAFVDPATDWEDPDNQFTVPIPARKTFSIRVRLAQPLDPRSVNTASCEVRKIASISPLGVETPVDVQVAIGTFLNQHRLGIVEIEITPATNLDPASKYQLTVRNLVKSLGGVSNLFNYVSTFVVGPGQPPLDAIREPFVNSLNRAASTDVDTLNQVTTALWPAPALFDATSSGKLAASFMQFAGTGVGAPSDPRVPNSPIVDRLNLGVGESIVFVTEEVDPSNPTLLGTHIEYNYVDVRLTNAAAFAEGRYPLVIRSQETITLIASTINVAGSPGADGTTNTDPENGGPTGGIGGAAGSGGFRGGDGGCAPLTDALGTPILDLNGNLQFDQTKFNGQNGYPGYLSTGPRTSGGGSGGFNGDREAANNVECAGPEQPPVINKEDVTCTPSRIREAGGGGGHATAGGDGAGARGSGDLHTEAAGSYPGGVGGLTYGRPDFGDQELNGYLGTMGVPRLTIGAGGAGGGGGGAEDNSPGSTAPDNVAGPQDSGGGGGGGGGGGVQLVARTQVYIDSSVINASGGRGGSTQKAGGGGLGLGAPGGSGAGGAIWICCFGDIIIQNGSTINCSGGSDANSLGFFTVKPDNTNPLLASPLSGKGGLGGDGYVRFEDSDGAAVITGSTVTGVLTEATFAPYDDPSTSATEAFFQAFPGAPFVQDFSQGFSVWFDSKLDTPSFAVHDDDLAVPGVEGTSFFEGAGQVDIWVRSAPNDVARSGHPNLLLATAAGNTAPWTPYVDVATISRRRYLQFRVDFTLPLSYNLDKSQLPYVDFLRVDINLN